MQSRPLRDAVSAWPWWQTLLAAFAATLFVSARAKAQDAQLVVSGGSATDQSGVHSNALTIAPSMSLAPAAGASLSLGANATRYGNNAWSLGGGAAFSGHDAIARLFAFTLDASASASHFQPDGGAAAAFASAELLPALQLEAGRLTLFGGERVATGFASLNVAQPSLPGFRGTTGTQSQTRNGVGPTLGANIDVASSADGTLRIGAREDHLRISDVAVVDRAISASVATNAVTLSGSVGRRFASDEHVGFGSAALSVALGGGLALDAGAGRYASNRLTGTPGGDYFNVGLSLRFGRSNSAAPSLPHTTGVPRVASGYTRLSIDAPEATHVDVAGDFNEWTPVPATRAANGVWYADLRIAPGQYRYAFRVNGKEWRVPHGATAVEDGFGGKSAWLTVQQASS